MNIIKNKYIKFLFTIVCLFFVSGSVDAVEFSTLQKTINCAGAEIPYGFPYVVRRVIVLLKIFTPIILIILGMVDFLRATISSDEKQMKDASSRFVRRILAAVIVFFVIAIVQFAFRLVGDQEDSALGCFNCFVNGNCDVVEKTVENTENDEGKSTSHESSSDHSFDGSGRRR